MKQTNLQFKFILILIFIVFSLTGLKTSFANEFSLYENASISNVSILGFQGTYNDKEYNSFINTDKVVKLTGRDNKQYHCWSVEGTGYADTLGAVFFQYENQASYICNDGKRRGKAKLGAGGRINFNGKKDGKVYSGTLKKIRYKNDDGEKIYFYHQTGSKAYSDGLGMWTWQGVKTKFDYISGNVDLIDFENSDMDFSGSSVLANGMSGNNTTIEWKDKEGNTFDYLILPRLRFTKQSFSYNDSEKSGLFFSDLDSPKSLLENIEISGNYSTDIYSIVPGDQTAYLEIGTGNILTGDAYFDKPFDIDFQFKKEYKNNRILQYDDEKAKLNLTGQKVDISNYNFNDLSLSVPDSWVVSKGETNAGVNNSWFDFSIHDDYYITSNRYQLSYKFSGQYDIKKNGQFYKDIPVNDKTSYQPIYLNKKVDEVNIAKNNCTDLYGNGQDWCNLEFEFKNEKGQALLGMKYDITKIQDLNKSSGDYTSFDLNEVSGSPYKTGFYFSGKSSQTNGKGISTGKFVSYKPVKNGNLKFVFDNITGSSEDVYNWGTVNANSIENSIDNINFEKVVKLTFSGIDLGNGIAIDENHEIDVIYTGKDGVDVDLDSNGGYQLSGKIYPSSATASFQTGGVMTGDFGSIKQHSIYISGYYFDYASYYDKFYFYGLYGENGPRIVKLNPNKKINSNLQITPQFIGSKVMGIINKGYNILSMQSSSQFGTGADNQMLGTDSKRVGSQINKLKRKYNRKLRGQSPTNLSDEKIIDMTDLNGGIQYYKCQGDGQIIIKNNDNKYNGQNEIVVYNCPVVINGDIKQDSEKDTMQIYSFSTKGRLNFRKNDGWKAESNIYIYPGVQTIQADMITDGAVLTTKSQQRDFGNIFFGGRNYRGDLRNQLYVNGQVISKNTFGGGVVNDNDKVILPGDYKINKDKEVYNKKAYKVAQAFDVNFWRSNYKGNNGNYNVSNVSSIVKDKYGCSGNPGDSYQCTKPVIIENNQ